MATVVKTQRPEDFLALVPQLAGFRPRNSVMVVAFRGNRTCAALRFDLPDASAGEEEPASGSDTDAGQRHRAVSSRLVGILCKVRGADAVVPVVYTDDSFVDSGKIPHADFVDALVSRARVAGFLVRDALCVAEDGWGSYLDQDCPRQGLPLAAIDSSPVNGAIPRELREDLGPVDAGSELPTVDLATKERVARLLARLRDTVGAPSARGVMDSVDPVLQDPVLQDPVLQDPVLLDPEVRDPGTDVSDELHRFDEGIHEADGWDDLDGRDDLDGWDDLDADLYDRFDADSHDRADDDRDDDLPSSGLLPGFVEDALQVAPGSIDDRVAAVLILCLQSPMLRDVVMLQWAFGLEVGELALEENERYFAGEDPAKFVVAPLMWGDGPRPDVGRVLNAIALVMALAARAPRSARPPLLCQLAWFSWALGRSSLAARFVDEAEVIDPRYGLAELLRSMLEAGHLPEWAFAVPDGAGRE